MRKHLLPGVVAAWLAIAVVAASASTHPRTALGPLPPRGLAVATANATIFLDFKGHELGRIPSSYGVYRTPHGQLLLSKGHTAFWTLRPSTGELVPLHHVLRLWNTPAWAQRTGCRPQSVRGATWYLACSTGIVSVTHNGATRTLTGKPAGHEWRELMPSPDGKMLLANASRECDGSHAYILRAAGGAPRSLVTSDLSYGIGWATPADAVVFLPFGTCGANGLGPGVYAFGLGGGRRPLFPGRLQGASTWGS